MVRPVHKSIYFLSQKINATNLFDSVPQTSGYSTELTNIHFVSEFLLEIVVSIFLLETQRNLYSFFVFYIFSQNG